MRAKKKAAAVSLERTRQDVIKDQCRKVKHGQRLMVEHIGSVPTMPMSDSVPIESLAYVCYRSSVDGDEYWRLCKVQSVGLTCRIELCDTGEIRWNVDRDAVRLLLAGKARKPSKGEKKCAWCDGVITGKGRVRYCKTSCRAAAERQRRKAVK